MTYVHCSNYNLCAYVSVSTIEGVCVCVCVYLLCVCT